MNLSYHVRDFTDLVLLRAGIDGGGVFKEFFTSLCKEVFNADRGLWLSTKNNELYPNPSSIAKERMFRMKFWNYGCLIAFQHTAWTGIDLLAEY